MKKPLLTIFAIFYFANYNFNLCASNQTDKKMQVDCEEMSPFEYKDEFIKDMKALTHFDHLKQLESAKRNLNMFRMEFYILDLDNEDMLELKEAIEEREKYLENRYKELKSY